MDDYTHTHTHTQRQKLTSQHNLHSTTPHITSYYSILYHRGHSPVLPLNVTSQKISQTSYHSKLCHRGRTHIHTSNHSSYTIIPRQQQQPQPRHTPNVKKKKKVINLVHPGRTMRTSRKLFFYMSI